jgi:TonB family protein
VQTDLGDWYLTGGATARALPVYREAWNSLAQAGGQKLLTAPVPLTYHPPPASVARGTMDPSLYDAQTVELRLTIEANGNVRDAVVVNPVPEREAAERAVAAAVKRATFRPVFSEGASITSTDQVFTEQVYVKRPRVK